jgi:hypothetical protein
VSLDSERQIVKRAHQDLAEIVFVRCQYFPIDLMLEDILGIPPVRDLEVPHRTDRRGHSRCWIYVE